MNHSIFTEILKKYQSFKFNQICCICGSKNCSQNSNHFKITIEQFQNNIQNCKQNKDQIAQIKLKIFEFYKQIKLRIVNAIDQECFQLQTNINQYYFKNDFFIKNKIDKNLIIQLLQKNVNRLPNKKIDKINKILKNIVKNKGLQMKFSSQQLKFEQNIQKITQTEQLKQKILKKFQFFYIQQIVQSLKMNLPLSFINQEQNQPKLKHKKSTTQTANPQQTDEQIFKKIYQWRNVKITQNSRTLAFSNKNLSDRQVMEQLPILSSFPNIRQFQIRNNKISSLSCNLIANNMPFLISLDIRGNKINDKGIIKLINGFPKLKSFFISETLATDESGKQVAEKLPQLQMFWSQHTNITSQIGLKIASKPRLKVLSLINNPIDDEYKQKMKKIFISKGYIAI